MRRPDTAYVNGKVYTVDGKFSVVSAFCVEGDRFVAAGTDDEIRALCTPETKIIDLGGKCVLPGLIDSHLHVNNTGAMKMELNIVGRQREEIVAMVAEAYKAAKPGEWIVGRGWLNDEWNDKSFPTKEELDAVAPDIPVYLKRACGHAAWVNSAAFAAVGVTNETPDPTGGEYLRRDGGELLGTVTDQAQDPFNKAIPPYNKEQLQRIVLLAQEGFFAAGLTTVHASAHRPARAGGLLRRGADDRPRRRHSRGMDSGVGGALSEARAQAAHIREHEGRRPPELPGAYGRLDALLPEGAAHRHVRQQADGALV